MSWIKTHKYLIFLLGLNVILWTAAILLGTKTIQDDKGIISVICVLVIPWYILLPLDAFFVSRLYKSKRKWISIVCAIIVYLSFLIVMDPGARYDIGMEVNTGLYRFARVRAVTDIFSGFIIILNLGYILITDLVSRYLLNKLYKE